MRVLGKLTLIFLSLFPVTAQAYNFLYIHPTERRPIGWAPGTTIHYYLDPGKLGRLTNEQAHTLLKEAMKIWENASPYADVPHFEFAGYLPEDVDGGNYGKYVSLSSCYANHLDLCPSDAQKNLQTVIIFDEDDSILNNELCSIGGCAASSGAGVFSGTTADPQDIAQGVMVIGGGFAGSSSAKIRSVVGLMVHELGHLLGLAHTSVNEEAIINDTKGYGRYIPTMYESPASYSNLDTEKSSNTLNPDDIAGISTLYPTANFTQQTATIKGGIFKSDGSPMMHVNVIARNTEDTLCKAYSFLAGRTCEAATQKACENDIDLVLDPGFIILGLPEGSYTIEVEEVVDNLALTLAPGLVDPFIAGDAEFWNEGDTSDESSMAVTTIDLTAGETRGDVNIVLNRSDVSSDRIKYLPLSVFTQGPGTLCLQSSDVDYATLIGISESGSTDTTNSDPSLPVSSNPQTPTIPSSATNNKVGGCSLVYGNW